MQLKTPEGRSHEILMAVIRTHILTGEPVGSRVVSRQRKDGLSPASIRNIMLELEEEGYLEQPHTSAGRIPTDKAYRYYVSICDANQPPNRADEHLILSQLGEQTGVPEEVVFEKTSKVLSQISRNLGLVVCEPMERTILEHIHFVRMNDYRILVVIVCGLSRVRNRTIRVEAELSQEDLDSAAKYLNHHFRGWEFGKIQAELVRRLAAERAAYNKVLKDLQQLHAQGMLEDISQVEVFLEGTSNLIGQPELADPQSIRELLKALEGKENLVRLVNECIQSPGDPLQVVIGLPGRPSLLKSFALIGTPYCLEGKVIGRLAILGPVRMHYERVIRAVGYIGRLFQSQELN